MTDDIALGPPALTMPAMSLDQLDRELGELVAALHRAEQDWAPWLRRTCPSSRASARNLVHYWALRQHDLQDLQQTLSAYGLSSLGRSEPHVGASLAAVHALVKVLRGQQRPGDVVPTAVDGTTTIRVRAVELLGPEPPGRPTRIMVTLPSEAADDPSVAARLLARGMDVARINCAHDDPAAWTRMARNVREAGGCDRHEEAPAKPRAPGGTSSPGWGGI